MSDRAPLRGGTAALVACGALGVLAGCVEPDSGEYPRHGFGAPVDVAGVEIDRGGEIDLDPGQGVGVGIEYAGDGAWSITTACDTALSDAVCHFDVVVRELESAPAGITEAVAVGLEMEDRLTQPDPFSLELDVVTGSDLVGATFSAVPGATVRVEALLYDPLYDSALDWVADPRSLYWVGASALQAGAPSDPVDLTPDQP